MTKLKLTRQELYDMVWKEPMSTIAKKFNITDTGLRKACKRMDIPTPMNGYWAKLQFGKPVFQESLPNEYNGPEKLEIEQLDEKSIVSGESDAVRLTNEIKADKSLDLTVHSTLKNACQLVYDINEYYQKKLLETRVKNHELLMHRESFLDVAVTPKKLGRLLRFADALIKNLKQRGHQVKIVNGKTELVLFDQEIQISFRECTRREQIIETEYNWTRTVFIPTGVLSFKILNTREWKDGRLLLEEQLPNILAQLELLAMKLKTKRDIQKEWQAENHIKMKVEEEKRENKQNEIRLFKNLLSEAKHFNKAQMIRRYIEEAEKRAASGSLPTGKNVEWIHWAQSKADWFDPLVTKIDPVLGRFSIEYFNENSWKLF